MESGGLVHIITAKNIRWLHTSTREVSHLHEMVFTQDANYCQILYSYEDELGTDVIASLDFWQTANGGKQSLDVQRAYEKS
jgi:hypothetical protein